MPVEKYYPNNILTYNDYLHYISNPPPWQIKFRDRKCVKGEEIFQQTGRVDPITRVEPQCIVPSDFRNMHCIVEMVTVDWSCWPPMLFAMGEKNRDAAAFLAFITQAIAGGWI